jgi:hypothetical protein
MPRISGRIKWRFYICLEPNIRSALPVLWIRICMDPELFVGSGSGTRGSGSKSKTDGNLYKNHQKMDLFRNFYHYKILILCIIWKLCFKMLLKDLKILVLEKSILGRIRNRIRNFLKVGSGSVTLRKVGSDSVTSSFGQCWGSGSGQIWTFLPDPEIFHRIRIPDPDLTP